MKKLITILLFIILCACVYAQDTKPMFILETGKPGNLFYIGQIPQGSIVATDPNVTSVKGTIYFYDNYGKLFDQKNVEFTNAKPLNLPNKKGCVEIKYNFTINNKDKAEGSMSYGIIPDNQKIALGKSSCFGVNTHFNQYWDPSIGKIVKRVGCSWIRDGEAFIDNERALPVAMENGLEYMPCFTNSMRGASFKYVKEEMAKGKPAEGPWDFTSSLECLREYIKTYGDNIDFYNVMNEENYSGWRDLGGEEYYGPWLPIFIQWAKQVSNIIREMDPTAKIVWDDANFSNIYYYINMGIDKEIDYISIHPYAPKPEHTYRLYNHKIQNIEDVTLEELYKRFNNFKDSNNRNWKVMEGENGFPSFVKCKEDPTGYASRTPDIQAAALVRMYMSHLACGAERIIWYDFKDDGTNPGMAEENFGLVKYDGSPKPSVCAFANLINIIEGSKEIVKNDNYNAPSYVYNFINKKGEKGMVLWVEPSPVLKDYKGLIISKTNFTMEVNIPTNNNIVKLVDMFGNETKLRSRDGKLNVTLSEYPVYLLGL